MAIAGVKPVELTLFNKFGINVTANTHGVDVYTVEQVREILIKFANSKNAMRRDMTAEHIVDEFMEGGEE